jgi:hypothetical protein
MIWLAVEITRDAVPASALSEALRVPSKYPNWFGTRNVYVLHIYLYYNNISTYFSNISELFTQFIWNHTILVYGNNNVAVMRTMISSRLPTMTCINPIYVEFLVAWSICNGYGIVNITPISRLVAPLPAVTVPAKKNISYR